jgi:diguanylate cyclase (GGDEF)-like protein
MKIKIFLLSIFLAINTLVFFFTKSSAQNNINIVLKNSLKTLNTHYKILLQTQRTTALTIYKSTIQIPKLLEIIAEANSATKEKKAKLRNQLHELLYKKYQIIKGEGVLQYHFVLPNNESFYRAHKPSKFGDDLTNIREDFKYTNETKKSIRGFTQGRTTHGFRNTFPLFDKNNNYIGALEVSFSSDSFQWYLNNISGIHSHFIVDKHIFDAKAWQRDDLVLAYNISAESKNFMITLNGLHSKKICISDNLIRLKPMREIIDSKMLLGKAFNFYVDYKNQIIVVSFLPIKNISNKTVAWIVSYVQSSIIKSTLFSELLTRVVSFFISLLIVYLLIKQFNSKLKLEKQHLLLNNILNSIDNIIFIINNEKVIYINDKFKELFNIKSSDEFNKKTNYHIFELFVHEEGSLHSGLLYDNEQFFSLFMRTSEKDRIVTIIDKDLKKKIFKIDIANIYINGDYLITLSDITKINEFHMETEEKVYIDGLTHVFNRNKFNEVFKDEFKNTKRYSTPLSLAIIDIDNFKLFNDNYGHLIGDEVLIRLAQTVKNSVRETDIFARWGGEEFVIIFKNTPIEKAKNISEKLKDKIESNKHPSAGRITASFGVTEYKDGDSLESMFKRVDDALYIAKQNGKNRMEVL